MSRRQFALPAARCATPTRRHRLHGAARRHGRLLRLRVSRSTVRPASAPGHRRRGRPSGSCSRPPTRRAVFGVTSAMPMARARRLCPHGHRAAARPRPLQPRSPPPSWRPSARSPPGRAALARRGLPRRRRGGPAARPPAVIAQCLRDTIADEQGITCSVGVAPPKFVAKLASGLAKPDGHARRAAGRGRDLSCISCRSARCGAWGTAPRRRWSASGCAPSPTSPTPLSTRCAGRWVTLRGAHLHDLAWGRDPRAGRARASREEHRLATRRSTTTSTTRPSSTASCSS